MYKKNDSKMLSSLSMIQFKFIPSKPNTETSISYILTYILFLSKTFGQALDRLVNVS